MPPQPSSAPVAAGAYRIDAARSRLLVLVRRAGPMAALGHNHVLANRAVSGWAHWDGVPERAAFELELPAAAFSVDEAPLRAAAGADFAENVDEEARNGTRANLLGPAVLDAGEHPTIRVRSERIEVVGGELKATVRVEVAGHESRHVVPLRLDGRPDTLDGHVSVDLEQSTLGLTPFSVFMGALRVADTLRVELDVTAVAAR